MKVFILCKIFLRQANIKLSNQYQAVMKLSIFAWYDTKLPLIDMHYEKLHKF